MDNKNTPPTDIFFTLDEVSKYLKISKSTLYKLSERKDLPSIKIGKQLRFRKSSLDKWFSAKEGISSKEIISPANNDTAYLNKTGPKHILLVDDDELVLKTISKFLKNYNYDVASACCGEDALEKAEESDFDLIIIDVRMPGIDGIETIKRIREFNQAHNRPKLREIIITAYIDTESQREAEGLGVSDYIYKPFIAGDFIKIVKEKLKFTINQN